MKEALLRFTLVSFSGKLIFNGVQGHCHASIKSLFLKQQEDSTQHETVLIVSPGSLLKNTSIENIVCVHRVY